MGSSNREIPTINPNASHVQIVENINTNFGMAEGISKRENHWVRELEKLQSGIGVNAYFTNEYPLGADAGTVTNWIVHSVEDGYNIWKYNVPDYLYDDYNQLRENKVIIDNMGKADSVTNTTFDKVYILSGGVYTDNTSEAGTLKGTPFDLMTSTSEELLLGSSGVVSGMTFVFFRPGSGYILNIDYSTSSGWGSGATGYNGNSIITEDNTTNLRKDGQIRLTLPGTMASSDVNGDNYYWLKVKTTVNPTVKAMPYSVQPNNSVGGMLFLNQEQLYSQKIRRWCSEGSDVYVTIPNTGAPQYEGVSYIRSGSTTTTKQTYFNSNHVFSLDYKKQSYVPVTPYRKNYCFFDETAQPNGYMTVATGIPGTYGYTMLRAGYITGIGVSCVTAASTAAITVEARKNEVTTPMSVSLGTNAHIAYNTSIPDLDPSGLLTVSPGDRLSVFVTKGSATAYQDMVVEVEVSNTRV